MGNVTHLFNNSGSAPAIIERYKYDAFGAVTIYNAGGAQISASAYDNRFFFTGREYNLTFGFYEYRHLKAEKGSEFTIDTARDIGRSTILTRLCRSRSKRGV